MHFLLAIGERFATVWHKLAVCLVPLGAVGHVLWSKGRQGSIDGHANTVNQDSTNDGGSDCSGVDTAGLRFCDVLESHDGRRWFGRPRKDTCKEIESNMRRSCLYSMREVRP